MQPIKEEPLSDINIKNDNDEFVLKSQESGVDENIGSDTLRSKRWCVAFCCFAAIMSVSTTILMLYLKTQSQ
jgi:hypothetical protein